MSWVEETLETLAAAGGGPGSNEAVTSLTRRLEEGLSRTWTIEDARDVLGAGSLLLQLSSLGGNLVLPDWEGAIRNMEVLHPPETATAVIGLGDAGYALLTHLSSLGPAGASFLRFFIDLETSRIREFDPNVTQVVLEGTVEGDHPHRYGDTARAAYRAASRPKGLPPLLAEVLEASAASRLTVHVVVGLEDPWLMSVPDLLFDLRTFLDWGRRGRCMLHLVTRPLPRVRGAPQETVKELEQTRTFDDAFIICSNEQKLSDKVADFIALSAVAPELLVHHPETHQRGVLSSYGTARVPLVAEESSEEFLTRFDAVFRSAAPNWVPSNAVLGEMAQERVFYVHPPEVEVVDSAWKLCPELIPIVLEGVEPAVCRIHRGLKLEDLRLV